jgi:hypothetical protein
MSNDVRAFSPLYNQTQYTTNADRTSTKIQTGSCVVSVTVAAVDATAVASTEFPGTSNNPDSQIQIANKTSVWVHVNFGNITSPNTVRAATINDYPVAPGTVVIVTVDPEVNAASVFANGAPAASTSVVFTRGSGT